MPKKPIDSIPKAEALLPTRSQSNFLSRRDFTKIVLLVGSFIGSNFLSAPSSAWTSARMRNPTLDKKSGIGSSCIGDSPIGV